MFTQPNSGGGFFAPAEAVGHLILITKVHKIETVVDTYGGVVRNQDQATVDLVDLDALDPQTGQPAHRENVKIGHIGIVNRLSAGKELVLGRVGQVPTDKGNPAFVLQPYDETTDAPRAAAWVTAWRAGQIAQPTAPAIPVAAPAIPVPAPAVPATPGIDPALLAAAQAQLAAQAQAQAALQAQAAPPPAPAAAPQVDQAALAALLAQMGGTVQS